MSTLIVPESFGIKLEMQPVGTLTLEDPQGKTQYTPQEDITAYELALLVRLFFRLTLGGPAGATPDWRSFLDEHKLARHFTTAL